MNAQIGIGFVAGVLFIYATDWICWRLSQARLRVWSKLDDETARLADEAKRRYEDR